jgi:FKBP-type peptidyl-prolyl cis-trans isomerase
MINKIELIGILVCVGVMALSLMLLKTNATAKSLSQVTSANQLASVVAVEEKSAGSKKDAGDLEQELKSAFNSKGDIIKMVSDDIVVGQGKEVASGDAVTVHYVGTLQSGEQFDNSKTRGEAFTFTVGEGKVIRGWDEGVLGMKKGGQRVLIIPANMAYGSNAVGPIPANSTLIFSIELLEIK